MKRMFLLTMSSLLLHAFSGCKKELDYGGISFSFKGDQSYEYTSMYVVVSDQLNAEPLKEVSTRDVQKEVKITGLTPGTYYWRGRIYYKHQQFYGSYAFDGKIIIEKGKLMRITLEN